MAKLDINTEEFGTVLIPIAKEKEERPVSKQTGRKRVDLSESVKISKKNKLALQRITSEMEASDGNFVAVNRLIDDILSEWIKNRGVTD